MNNLRWRYTKVKGGVKQGINIAAVEAFAGNRIASMAREICQNSLDAKDEELGNKPVVIHFKEFKMRRNKFPDIESLVNSYERVKKQAKEYKDQKPLTKTNESLKVLKSDTIKFIRISDFNTLGLSGVESEKDTPWSSLTKSEGISDKKSSAGGSFGIGKNANFAVSNLNTVFYSTINKEGEKATIGVANLSSYRLDEPSTHTQGTEFLGIDEVHRPYPGLIELEKGYLRDEVGTDIYIAGFIDDVDNEKNIVKEILNNYLLAIYEESLIVEVNKIIISKESLPTLLKEYQDILEKQTQELYNLLTYENVNIYKERILEKDDIELRFIIDPNGSNTTSMIRKPWMKIYNETRSKRHYQFYGTCIIKGENLNILLRKAENPQHDKWEEDRSPDYKLEIRRALKNIRDKILYILEELHEVPIEESMDIFGAVEYIPMDLSGDEKAQEKVTDEVININIKDVFTQLENEQINQFEEEGEFVIDLDGNIDVEVIHPPVKEENKGTSVNQSKTDIKRGERIGIERRAIRVINHGNTPGKYVIHFNSAREYKNIILQIDALDEQGMIIKNALRILEAKSNNQYYSTNDNRIFNVEIEVGVNKIVIQTDLKLSIGIGVSVYDS